MTKNIMVVDDAFFMRKVLKEILKKGGYEVVAQVDNGVKGVQTYKEFFGDENKKIDLVLMDITMPEMDGITALKKIMEFDRNAKVVMCTALNMQDKVVLSAKMGAKDFIVKPFNAQIVLEKVNNCFK
ncbi:response regulator (plasmid) [Pontibacillus sp. ALD_SL1]|uniref:response regulator n=1 Tax=Pontibacillus sp. ALD_SL1 TaxID=2777185 RepID=UPI001A976047|nr:response regulator [Pontibacillus sp. ALD_SL1]QST03043.1 response regulator [Pontibacillus sp. ALD_SL1]